MKKRLFTFIITIFFGCLLTINNFSFFSDLKNDEMLIDAVVVQVHHYIPFLEYAEIELQNQINTETIYADIIPYSISSVSKGDIVKVKFKTKSQRYIVCPSDKDYWTHVIIIWLLVLLVIVLIYIGFKIEDK